MEGLQAALQDNGHTAQITGEPVLFDVFFSSRKIKNYRDVLQSDTRKSRSFNQLLRKQKIFKSDSKFYVSLAHTQDDIDLTILAMNHAAKGLKEL